MNGGFLFILFYNFSVSEDSLLVIVIMQFLNLAVTIQCSRVIAKRSASIITIVKGFDHQAASRMLALRISIA